MCYDKEINWLWAFAVPFCSYIAVLRLSYFSTHQEPAFPLATEDQHAPHSLLAADVDHFLLGDGGGGVRVGEEGRQGISEIRMGPLYLQRVFLALLVYFCHIFCEVSPSPVPVFCTVTN